MEFKELDIVALDKMETNYYRYLLSKLDNKDMLILDEYVNLQLELNKRLPNLS